MVFKHGGITSYTKIKNIIFYFLLKIIEKKQLQNDVQKHNVFNFYIYINLVKKYTECISKKKKSDLQYKRLEVRENHLIKFLIMNDTRKCLKKQFLIKS